MYIKISIVGGHVLMRTDAPESMIFNANFGNNVHISLERDTKEETKKLFEAFSAKVGQNGKKSITKI